MGAHLIDGEFQSDKYPTTPRGKVPLSVKDPTAQDLLWEYAQRRRAVDAEFADDLETALRSAGYDPEKCLHAVTFRGADAPRRWGSFRTQVCAKCRAFRFLTHHDKPITGYNSGWRPVAEYADAISPTELE